MGVGRKGKNGLENLVRENVPGRNLPYDTGINPSDFQPPFDSKEKCRKTVGQSSGGNT